MANYVRNIPRDKGGEPLQDFPAPTIALEQTVTDNAVASSIITLHPNTSSLEVSAVGGQGVVIRWIKTTETAAVAPAGSVVASGLGANFDHHIPAGALRRFAVPVETQGIGTGNMQVGSTFGLYQRVARINAGVVASSILVVEHGMSN